LIKKKKIKMIFHRNQNLKWQRAGRGGKGGL